jgi:exoribonuclease R
MRHDAARNRLVGERSGAVFGLGAPVRVTLLEADAVTGTLRFALDP